MTEEKAKSQGIYKKLTKARLMLSKRDIKKTGRGQYNYLELSDFLPHVHEIFDELGLCACIEFGADMAKLMVVDSEECSDVVFTSPVVCAQLTKSDPIKQLGATQTYLRRYLWLQAMEISVPDEVDASTVSRGATSFTGIHNTGAGGLDGMKDDLPEITIAQRVDQILKITNKTQLENHYKSLPIALKGNHEIVEAIKQRADELSPKGKA